MTTVAKYMPVYFINKTYHHDITEILLDMPLNTDIPMTHSLAQKCVFFSTTVVKDSITNTEGRTAVNAILVH